MYRKFSLLYALVICLFTTPLLQATAQEAITITLPEQTIAKSVKAVLPLNLDTRKIPIKGQFTVVDMGNLQITDGMISCKLKLAGKDMAIATNIGGHNINLDVGTVDINVDANSTVRFDAAKQTLYLRPTIKNTKTGGSGKAAQVAPTLMALLNGQEFPIALQPLQPAVIETGTKQIVINTKIVNVVPLQNKLQLHLLPIISSSGGK